MNQPASKNDSKQAALDILHQGVTDLMTSDGWKRALEFRQRFYTYSYMNTLLILAQRPDAQLVAGYRTWQASNRYVRKGEKGIGILAPLLVKDPDDADKLNLIGFKTVYVFDVSQTDGEPLPQREAPQLLQDAPDAQIKLSSLHFRLSMFCASHGVSVSWDFKHPHALGVYNPTERHIAIRLGLSHTQAFKTLCHETAHMLLHTGNEARPSAELEAETAAFLVCHALGIDTSSYSFVYLASWSDSLEDLIQAGDRASKAANQILDHLQQPADSASEELTLDRPKPGQATEPVTSPPRGFLAH